jgi:MEMO1 family protein
MTLPALRMNLDFMPSPVEDRPGLLIRDPYHFSDATLIVPQGLVECLRLFDGEHSDLDLRECLVNITGEIEVGELQRHLTETLSAAGFLLDAQYEEMRETRLTAFRDTPVRMPVHAGGAYPAEPEPLRLALTQYMTQGFVNGAATRPLVGIAAPHVSPEGGWSCYQAAYRALDASYAERTFVVLGTSHYGERDRFGLTRKNFLTPYGEALCDTALVDRLHAHAPAAILMEDYCHAVEHSIEFQIIFLQHLFGPRIRILPILCGSFVRSIYGGGVPEDDETVRRFLDALSEMSAREGGKLLWVLGIDMAHMGRRYGDPYAALAHQGPMADVAARDQARIARLSAGDARGFWDLIQENRDDLKWCGSAPLYAFMKAVPQARGELLRYEQWNIDEQSVVSFAGLSFSA